LKKIAIVFCVLLMFATLSSTQTYVLAEMFTRLNCGWCPSARSALRTMAEDQHRFPYLIPLIFQEDINPSPGNQVRVQRY